MINSAWLADVLIGALGDGSQFGVTIRWTREEEGLETGGGIINALPLLGTEPFILVNGDVLDSFDFAYLLDVQLDTDFAHLVFVPNPTQIPKATILNQGHLIPLNKSSRARR